MIKVTLSAQAADFLTCVPATVRDHLVKVIREKSAQTENQMVVTSWTMDGNYPHIERAFKDYRFKPGIRMLFHIIKRDQQIHIDRICWRDENPYGDEGAR